jgi:TolB protein
MVTPEGPKVPSGATQRFTCLLRREDGSVIQSFYPVWALSADTGELEVRADGSCVYHAPSTSTPTQITLAASVGDQDEGLWLFGSSVVTVGAVDERDRIVFHSDRDGNDEVYVMEADGSDEHNLTQNAGQDENPAWSPDKSRIAFQSDRNGDLDIYVMDANGSNVQRLTDDPGSDRTPSWSPDGDELAFISNRGGNYAVYTMRDDGTQQTPLTAPAADSDDWKPRFAPDGQLVAFYRRQFNDAGHTSELDREIWAINPDGTGEQQLTDSTDAMNYSPSWSKDGFWIAFASDRTGDWDIWLMRPDGTGQVNITKSPSTSDVGCAWSPDSSRLAYASRAGDEPTHIWAMNADGSYPVQLTDSAGFDVFPDWSN